MFLAKNFVYVLDKRKCGRRLKRKGNKNNPFGRKGKAGAQQSKVTETTSAQPPPDSGAHGLGTSTNKKKTMPTKPPPSARAIKVWFYPISYLFHLNSLSSNYTPLLLLLVNAKTHPTN